MERSGQPDVVVGAVAAQLADATSRYFEVLRTRVLVIRRSGI